MSKITQVFEDLASGRPIKKPVKSNLLKARKDANEKALKSGFMKMPDYARKKFDEEKEEEYKPHYMYKGDKKVYAKKKEDHDKLNKQGYDHDDPKTKKIEEGKKKGLWDNIHARRKKGLPPKKPGQEGYPKTLNIEEKKPKNCGCGQDPCITYGKGGKMEKEQVNEISDEMKMRYISKANKQISSAEKERLAGKGHAVKTDKDYDRLVSKPLKRRKGVVQAKSKLGEEKKKGLDGKECWDGYKLQGTKKKGGKTVDNCVKIKEEMLSEISKDMKLRYISQANKSISKDEHMKDYLQRQMNRSNAKTPGTFSGMNKKFVDDKYDKDINKRRKGVAKAKASLQKESSSWVQQTADTWNDHADHPHPKVKKHIKAAEKAYNNQDMEAFHHHTNRAADHAHSLKRNEETLDAIRNEGYGPTIMQTPKERAKTQQKAGIELAKKKGMKPRPFMEAWFDTNSWPTHNRHRQRTAARVSADTLNSDSVRAKFKKMHPRQQAAYTKKVRDNNNKKYGYHPTVGHPQNKTTPLPKHLHHPKVGLNDSIQRDIYMSLMELSPKTISSYQKKAGAQYRQLRKDTPSRASADGGYYKGYISDKEYDSINTARDKMKRRGKGLSMSAGKGVKKESFENIYELKKSTLGSYVKKATGDAISRSHTSQYNIQKGMSARDKGQEKIAQKHFKKSEKESKKTMDRFHGINRAANKLTPGKDKDEYLADKNKTKMGASEKTFKQMHSGKVKATNEEKMSGSEYTSYMKNVKSTDRQVRKAVTNVLDKATKGRGASLHNKHKDHPEVKAAQKYMTVESLNKLIGQTVSKIRDAAQEYKKKQDASMKAGKGIYQNPMSGDNIAKRLGPVKKKVAIKGSQIKNKSTY